VFEICEVDDAIAIAPKVDRHTIFASWIVDTFGGLAALQGGVVDVAGGKGHLSNAITAQGVPCTLVDPFAGLGRNPVKGMHVDNGAPYNYLGWCTGPYIAILTAGARPSITLQILLKNDSFWGVRFSKMYFPRRALQRTPQNGVYGGI